MTNLLKAETTLKFPNDVSYKAKMSLDTIMGIESALGTSILKVANKLSTGELSLMEIITIMTLSIRAGGNDIKDSDVKKLVSDLGLIESIKTAGDLLTLALDTGEKEDEKKSES
tara:strand:+ start:636 stop:977 length:342 start_codon:yes stop_codon:yes gene_type:complete